MKFEDTKLPNEKVVRDAFDHAQENVKEFAPEIEAQLGAQLEMVRDILTKMEEAKNAGRLSEEKYNAQKAQLEQQKNMIEKNMPMIVAQQLDGIFRQKVLAPVMELHNHSENNSPEVLAAALLLDCVPDPVDFEEIVAKFGKGVSDPLKNVLHIDAHRGAKAQEANLAKASEGERRIFKAELAIDLMKLPSQAMQLPMGMSMKVDEESLFRPIKQLWGGDKKQDARLLDVFNKVATALKSSYKIELTDGAPVLVKNVPQKALPPGKKPPMIGDDGF